MKFFLIIFSITLVSCIEKRDLCRKPETSSQSVNKEKYDLGEGLRAEFISSKWTVKITNKRDERVLLASEIHGVSVFSDDGRQVGGSGIGTWGDNFEYKVILPRDEHYLEFDNSFRHLTGRYICEIYYIDNLNVEPKTLEFTFEVR